MNKKIIQGFGTGFIFLALSLIFIQIYAFVNGNPSPSTSYVIDQLNPINKMHNESYQITQEHSNYLPSFSANKGKYQNIIINGTFPLPFSEICFKDGSYSYDLHYASNDSTQGGNCEPGDIGFIMEIFERDVQFYENAKFGCIKDDMRLPEPFEIKFACENAAEFGLNSMTGNWEWYGNYIRPFYYWGLRGKVFGYNGCYRSSYAWVTYHSSYTKTAYNYRCVR